MYALTRGKQIKYDVLEGNHFVSARLGGSSEVFQLLGKLLVIKQSYSGRFTRIQEKVKYQTKLGRGVADLLAKLIKFKD